MKKVQISLYCSKYHQLRHTYSLFQYIRHTYSLFQYIRHTYSLFQYTPNVICSRLSEVHGKVHKFRSRFTCKGTICIYRVLRRCELPRKLDNAENFVALKEANTKLARKISLQCKHFGFCIFTPYIKHFMFSRLAVAPLLHTFPAKLKGLLIM